jgi:hypothetical protein
MTHRNDGGEASIMAWTAEDLRDKAQRCRNLQRVAVSDDIRDQLREWADDFDTEAEMIEERDRANSRAGGAR